ncbi:Eco57I restriction-modification methylase domain-containing protein [Nitrolancea hollandica]|uniref:site-specific DNA-methyltransferase (adenine-specific) n=1 Tax=Nitrolancea hollandica Lb TaxID=1129897 RepID=I4EIB3_9BACT|nr:N-6 DNA methylase [Nitrolancea hollandica]CCF84425.1 putative DNA methylase [Nitrolancea hollandica Lb]
MVASGVLDLVERFTRNRDDYRSGRYNETQLRREFLDPFFEALGWDVNNRQGYAEAYKDVIHEDAIKIGGYTKAPDYCFRIGGTRKFFVEAKKPSVNLRFDTSPAFQLRRYAWSAKLPLSILTDFEEFAVYDCRIRPVQTDKASTARILYVPYTDYAEHWDEIAKVFSREAILKGSFDAYAESSKAKRGTAEVDAAFLKEIESWRESLARNLALRNPGLTQRQLNFAVQMTIDRIIFLRMAEDRGIEEYGRLLALRNGGNVYDRLRELFVRADERYNSGLFHFHQERDRAEPPDDLTPGLTIDDRPLKEIIKSLYYPDSPYEFAVLPVAVLGQVYEQFLGKVITLTSRRKVEIEEKPEVRKAGGVYYTPTYIVDYIVEHTVGKLLEGKKPGPRGSASKLKILDPACGSGSFLIGAYQYLLDWHRDRYVEDGPEKHTKELYQGHGGQWLLTTQEKKRILLNNIYGVDIDPQAVEVTKLSLLLKVLEGESEQSLVRQLSMFHERALPDLSKNIKCGNSLIGPDFYDNAQMSFLSEEEQYRINVFDWRSGFPDIFSGDNPGFDAVIGNPPYIRIQALKEWAPIEVEYYKRAYRSAGKGNYDIYVVFAERGLSLLNGHGRLGFILPHKFFNAQYGQALRGLLADGKHLSDVVHFGDEQVFESATTYTCLLFLNKAGTPQVRVTKVDDLADWRVSGEALEGAIPASRISASEWNFVIGKGAKLFERLSQIPVKLGDVTDRIAQGIRTSANEVYVVDLVSQDGDLISAHSTQLDRHVDLERDALSLFLQGREIKPYQIQPSGKAVIIPYAIRGSRARLISERDYKETYPLTFAYLNENKARLEGRERGRMCGTDWYGYVYPKNIEVMTNPKILVPDIADRASFALDENGDYAFTSGYGITITSHTHESIKYILGLLNSSVLDFYLKRVSTPLRGGFFRYFTQFVEQLPIRTIDFDDPTDKARHDQMVALVERMLELHKRLSTAKIAHEKTMIQRQIEATDRQIDRLVYELYGLTEEEIVIVEEATGR